jgi:hypothetical protein
MSGVRVSHHPPPFLTFIKEVNKLNLKFDFVSKFLVPLILSIILIFDMYCAFLDAEA